LLYRADLIIPKNLVISRQPSVSAFYNYPHE
jgi:hypothetical protein